MALEEIGKREAMKKKVIITRNKGKPLYEKINDG